MPFRRITVANLKPGMTLSKEGNEQLPPPYNNKIHLSEEDVKRLIASETGEISISESKLSIEDTILAISGKAKLETLDNEPGFPATLKQFMVNREIPVDLYYDDGTKGVRKLISSGGTMSRVIHETLSSALIDKFIIPESQRKRFELYQVTLEKEHKEATKEGLSGKFTNHEEVVKHHHFMDSYIAINTFALVPGTRPDFDIFSRDDHGAVNLLLEKGGRVDENSCGKWIEEDANVLILKEMKGQYQSYLQSAQSGSKDPKVRAACVRENSKLIISGLAENPRSEMLMKHTQQSVADLSATVMENKTTFYSMMKINNHDYYTFTHSVNVSTMMLALAMEMGITDKKTLADLGLGGMLHDLGKAKIPNRIINKPGHLTDAEFDEIKSHVNKGYEMLKGNDTISENAFYPLLQHHEKLTGKGYPNRLPAEKIHQFGRIAAVIDIYDALTTQRSYKKAMSPFEALTIISKCEGDYDQEIFSTLVKLIRNQEMAR